MTENVKVELTSIIAIKSGMTRIFDETGKHIPVTVVKLIPNVISQVKTDEKDGYSAYQVAYYEKRQKLVSKPNLGQLKKANISETFSRFSEVRLNSAPDVTALGKQVSFENFKAQTCIDVTGISKGKGFQGVMKRHNFRGGPAAHGSHFHRRAGSIGNRATPARVFPQKKMPGHMGDRKTTVQNLSVVGLNLEKGYLLIKGSVPGAKNGFIRISMAVKEQ